MKKAYSFSASLLGALVGAAILAVVALPGLLAAEPSLPLWATVGYEAAWFLLRATLTPLVIILPLVLILGLVVASYFLSENHNSKLKNFLFLLLSFMAQLPTAFFVLVALALLARGVTLNLAVALPLVYFLVLLPRFSVPATELVAQLGSGLYEAGLAFGASQWRTLVQLVWPAALVPLLGQLLHFAALLSLEVTPAVLLTYALSATEPLIRPVTAEFFFQISKLSGMPLITFIIVILSLWLFFYGIAQTLQNNFLGKTGGEQDAR